MSSPTIEAVLSGAASWAVVHADNAEVFPRLRTGSIDALVTDPPAGIGFMGKEWDGDRGGRDDWVSWLAGVMREALRVLKPGAHALVWALPRTSHWTATALEDAGFEVRDVITHLFGTGFPKSLDVSKAIDKRREDDPRPVCRFLRAAMDAKGLNASQVAEPFGFHSRMVDHWAARDTDSQPTVPTLDQWEQLRTLLGFSPEMDAEVYRLNERKGTLGEAWQTAPVVGVHAGQPGGFGDHRFAVRDNLARVANTDAAKQWEGWGTALKPAAEHWILCRKPLVGTVAQNVAAHGTGGLNIDACRIGTEVRTYSPSSAPGGNGQRLHGGDGRDVANARAYAERSKAAPPITVEGRWPAHLTLDEEAAALLDEQSGERPTGGGGVTKATESVHGAAGLGSRRTRQTVGYSDSGGASRFFYVAKPSTAERDAGCEHLPVKSGGEATGRADDSAGVQNPRAGAGRRGGRRNHHPTVKPVALMRWLCRLITPPGGTVLDPFAGSGTTGVAALAEGLRFIGVEQSAEYAELARVRIATEDPSIPEDYEEERQDGRAQLSLFGALRGSR